MGKKRLATLKLKFMTADFFIEHHHLELDFE